MSDNVLIALIIAVVILDDLPTGAERLYVRST